MSTSKHVSTARLRPSTYSGTSFMTADTRPTASWPLWLLNAVLVVWLTYTLLNP